MISIDKLTKRYNRETVLDVDHLEISNGECFGLVGNNGAGKTTLFRLILDLIKPTTGNVLVDGRDVKSYEEWKSSVGSYLDEHMLLSFLTPVEYFETLQKIYSMRDNELNAHLGRFENFFNGEILEKNKYIRNLSKGNIKKTGIAAALMGWPDTVLLDEPFENLDPTSQNRLKTLIVDEQQENGTTFLISSHDLTHVTDICNRIVLLEKGKILHDLKDEKEVMSDALNNYFDR